MKAKTNFFTLFMLTCIISSSQALALNYSRVFNSCQLFKIIDMKVDSTNNFIYDFDLSLNTNILNTIFSGNYSSIS